MQYKKKYLLLILFIASTVFLLGLISSILINNYNNSNNANLLQTLSKSNLKTLDNLDIKKILQNTHNKYILINFWATWCASCIKEMPLLASFYTKHTDKLAIIGIAADNKENVQKFITKNIHYHIIIAGFEGIELSKQYGNNLGVLPYTLLLDKNGNIMQKHIGELKSEQLDNWLKHIPS